MRYLPRLLVFALLALAPHLAFATEYDPASNCRLGSCAAGLTTGDVLINNVALNGAQSTRTTPGVYVEGRTSVSFTISYTRSAGTDFSFFCEESDDNSAWRTYYPVDFNGVVLADTAGAAQPLYKWSALTASASWKWTVGVTGLKWIRCYGTVTSAGANDKWTVKYSLFY